MMPDRRHQVAEAFELNSHPKTTLLKAFLATFLPAFILACLISVWAGIRPAIAVEKSYTIGLSLPLSGNAALLGKQYIAGARLALKQLPGGENIKLIISDDGCDEKLAELAIEDITEAGAILITGFLCNKPVFTALRMLKGKDIPLLVAGARSNRILKDRPRHDWDVWQIAPQDADGSQAAFNTLKERWRSVPFAIVDDGTVFGRTQADEFRAMMEDAGNKPQFVDNFRPAQSNQVGLIRRLSRAGVEAVFLAASGDDVALIGRNMIEFGTGLEIATGDSVSLLPYIEDNTGIPVGLLAIMPSQPEEFGEVQKLIGAIVAQKLEPEPYLFLGYATMQVVLQYLASDDRTFVNKRYSTILGEVKFDGKGKNIANQYHLYRWDGENFIRAALTK